jgi:hypothetical protein
VCDASYVHPQFLTYRVGAPLVGAAVRRERRNGAGPWASPSLTLVATYMESEGRSRDLRGHIHCAMSLFFFVACCRWQVRCKGERVAHASLEIRCAPEARSWSFQTRLSSRWCGSASRQCFHGGSRRWRWWDLLQPLQIRFARAPSFATAPLPCYSFSLAMEAWGKSLNVHWIVGLEVLGEV